MTKPPSRHTLPLSVPCLCTCKKSLQYMQDQHVIARKLEVIGIDSKIESLPEMRKKPDSGVKVSGARWSDPALRGEANRILGMPFRALGSVGQWRIIGSHW